ncbi:hypothetical protein Ga0080574_TMP3486 [Salipiger abyssi]|uniref:Uncharacterized protein n=1 Tax=Salipiger abyssi TaxID=1250539 RepID=A0A1P8UWS3_9RHOB|nr:hypothetical protein Ga0080574_TMP3486 [Salipiger abyssi]
MRNLGAAASHRPVPYSYLGTGGPPEAPALHSLLRSARGNPPQTGQNAAPLHAPPAPDRRCGSGCHRVDRPTKYALDPRREARLRDTEGTG